MGNAPTDSPVTAWASANETEPLILTVVCKNLLDLGVKNASFIDKLLKVFN